MAFMTAFNDFNDFVRFSQDEMPGRSDFFKPTLTKLALYVGILKENEIFCAGFQAIATSTLFRV